MLKIDRKRLLEMGPGLYSKVCRFIEKESLTNEEISVLLNLLEYPTNSIFIMYRTILDNEKMSRKGEKVECPSCGIKFFIN